jgi:hypothetical protein
VRTAANAKLICDCLSRGMPFVHACAVANISNQTLLDWRREDEQFRQAMETAIAEGVNARLRVIEEASADDWRAAAWLLEHCQPQHFARNRLEVTGADGAPLAAGVQLYLPQKETALVEIAEPVETAALTEGGDGANGE